LGDWNARRGQFFADGSFVVVSTAVSYFPVSALQYSSGLDVADIAGRRLSVRFEICLRLQSLYVAIFVGAVFGTHLGAEPARGDVVVFLLPKDNSTVYIKRVVGLPGDRIQMKQGLLHINGVPVTRERLADFAGEDPCGSTSSARTKRWRETLPNGVSHETLDCVDNGFYDNTNVYSVPSGHFFMLGDNRDNSMDSRVLSAMGYVPLENIIGRAGMIFLSVGRQVRTERIGLIVR
jgi:signal peptidase I